MRNVQRIAWLVSLAAAGIVGSAANASSFPYFTGFGPADDVLDSTGAAFALDTGSGVLNYTQATSNTQTNGIEQVTGVAGNDFVVETRFTFNDGATFGGQNTYGLAALATDAGFSTAGGNGYYLADWMGSANSVDAGRLRLLALGSGGLTGVTNGDTDGANANASSVVNGKTYILRLTGAYAIDGTLSLTLAMFESDGVTQIGAAATGQSSTTTPLTGTYFGLRNRSGSLSSGQTMSASYDDFTVTAVPEPASLALVAFGVTVMLKRRKTA